MKIVSYGGGWTDVYVNFRDGELRENESKISYQRIACDHILVTGSFVLYSSIYD